MSLLNDLETSASNVSNGDIFGNALRSIRRQVHLLDEASYAVRLFSIT